MELGFTGLSLDQDLETFRDLNVTWVKTDLGLDHLEKETPKLRRKLEEAQEHGIRVVVDLRVDKDWIQRNIQDELLRLEERGELDPLPEDDIDRRIMAIQHNQNLAGLVLQDRVAEWSALAVTDIGDLCNDYEIWGESNCPWVSGGCFGEEGVNYSGYLAATYRALKQVRPQARIWTGGNGMDLESSWLQGILDDGHGDKFDVCNWHPYFMRQRNFDEAGRALAVTYAKYRNLLKERGRNQPFACTEWGYANSPPNPWGVPDDDLIEWFNSNVIQQGVRSLTPSEVCRWYERDLEAMHDFGFEVVCIHSVRDAETRNFWGNACGITTWAGEKKPVYEVVKRWGKRLADEGRRAFES